MRTGKLILTLVMVWAFALGWVLQTPGLPTESVVYAAGPDGDVSGRLRNALSALGFTGRIELKIADRLGRPLNGDLVELGRLVFFDNILGLHEDNSCAGCHSPAFTFGDSQSIAIGVLSNGIAGQSRTGPRNMRKAPPVTNSAFFRRLMLNGRFEAKSGDPFDNSAGFKFPPPEGDAKMFGPGDDRFPTLLSAQGHIPQTELVEMAGFTGATTNPFFNHSQELYQFDDGKGTPLPRDKDKNGFLNEEIRSTVLKKLNSINEYQLRFADVFNGGSTSGFRITFPMVGQVLSEFQVSLTRADAPIDEFMRGNPNAMSASQKRGALLFFGKANDKVNCVHCHAVSGNSNEMFSDFENWVLAVPQIATVFGAGTGDVGFDGDGHDEDFGAAQVTGNVADRYKFRTSPLRNVALQPAFFHNGAFTRLEDAIRHHLDVAESVRTFSSSHLDPDLQLRMGPPVDLALLDEGVRTPVALSKQEFTDLLAFVRDGLLDPRAAPKNLCRMVPRFVPSGIPVVDFEGCPRR